MALHLNEEQTILQQELRQLLADVSSSDTLRQSIENSQPLDRDVWKALADLGVLGTAIEEKFGGVGLGALELGIVAQEVGRAVAPVPFFASVCQAAQAIALAGSAEQKMRWLPLIATGEAIGTFAWSEGSEPLDASFVSTALVAGMLTGRKTPVPDAECADFCIVVARENGAPILALVDLQQPGVRIRRLSGIDQLRQYSEIEFDQARADRLGPADATMLLDQLLNRFAVFEAFEQVGGAEAALSMVRDYTLGRTIFARPLASYQAIKHRLADNLAAIELAGCNALYAADSLDQGRADIAAAAATARIAAIDAYEEIARNNLQFHGGIGFTWEADCHFHYRRARLLALNLGSHEFWSDRLISALENAAEPAVASGTRISSRPDDDEDAAYRASARSWLNAQKAKFHPVPTHWETPAAAEFAKRWARAKHAAGYAAIARPIEFGGAGGTRRQQQIFSQEESRAGLAMPLGGMGYAQAMAAIGRHGTPEQRQQWEAATHSGDIYWCQLFSEPNAGSDLAAVRTRAVRQGDNWIINGQKVWTSGGHLADFGILLARTNPDAAKHAGLSFFIIDMHQPGITTRPIRQINGETGFCETFLVDAVVPDSYRLDDVGKGWAVAMSVLSAERTTTSGIGEGERRVSSTSAKALIQRARSARRSRGSALDSALVRSQIARFHVGAQGLKNYTIRLQQMLADGAKAPTSLPLIKLVATNRLQQIHAFVLDLDECGGIVDIEGKGANDNRFYAYVSSASSRIAGGADEVLRNQLAERALGMPSDPRADKDVPFSSLMA